MQCQKLAKKVLFLLYSLLELGGSFPSTNDVTMYPASNFFVLTIAFLFQAY